MADPCRSSNQPELTTFELLEEKAELARLTFDIAGVSDTVELICGDALDHLPNYKNVAFCFLDAEKEVSGYLVFVTVMDTDEYNYDSNTVDSLGIHNEPSSAKPLPCSCAVLHG